MSFGIPIFWIHLLVLLFIIYFGIRYGGVALGLLGGLGVFLLAFVFHVAPGKPPIEVMLIILAVTTTSATLEATGALDLIVRMAENSCAGILIESPISHRSRLFS